MSICGHRCDNFDVCIKWIPVNIDSKENFMPGGSNSWNKRIAVEQKIYGGGKISTNHLPQRPMGTQDRMNNRTSPNRLQNCNRKQSNGGTGTGPIKSKPGYNIAARSLPVCFFLTTQTLVAPFSPSPSLLVSFSAGITHHRLHLHSSGASKGETAPPTRLLHCCEGRPPRELLIAVLPVFRASKKHQTGTSRLPWCFAGSFLCSSKFTCLLKLFSRTPATTTATGHRGHGGSRWWCVSCCPYHYLGLLWVQFLGHYMIACDSYVAVIFSGQYSCTFLELLRSDPELLFYVLGFKNIQSFSIWSSGL
ncbi:hypothetical protein LXL04_028300 [Taraxacum kok-saghyz]